MKKQDEYSFLHYLEAIIQDRKKSIQRKTHYTNVLFNKGINKIAQKKVGEEAVEVVIEKKDNNDTLF